MSKKSSVNKSKKSGRRLKRSVRRTLAAVLMITAIGVAAIPVPENLAEEPDPGIGEGTGNETVVVVEPELYDYKVAETDTTYSNNITSLKDKSGKDKDTHPTYTIRESGSGYPRLIWQYKYFRESSGGNTFGIISGYNSKYLTSEIRIDDSIITEYVKVTFEEFNEYYSGETNTSVGDDGNGHNHVEYKCTSPTRPIPAVEFMQEYFPNDFNAYKDDYAEWEKSEDENKGDAPILSKTVGDLSDQQKQRYYCTDENNRVTVGGRSISLSDYTLVQVIDEGNPDADDSPGAVDQYVFVPQLIKADPTNKQVDPNGYLSQGAVSINGIGDEVFKGVQNVTSLTTSEDFPLNFIGVSAFEDSYIQNIDISNVTNISDRAFKGCHNLTAISMGQNNRIIGTEAFYDTRLREIKFEKGVTQIGAGAFAECTALTKIDFSKIENPVAIEKYAFYNSSSLTSVIVMKSGADFSQADFDKPGVEATAMVPIDTIGDGAFAVKPASSTLTTFTFPAMIARQQIDANSVGMGDCILAGRSGLQYVTMPSAFGQSRTAMVPLNTFYNCFNLRCVKFPDNGDYSCGFASYDSVTDNDDPSKSRQLFASVNVADFYVKGPKMANPTTSASPRRSTWTATTGASDVVPYMYIENGKKFYEVSNGTYLMCINENGYLTSCTLMEGIIPKDTDLTIPSEVGSTKIIGIAEGCFSDENLNNHVINLTISDDSISEIANGVFKGWKKLAKVYIGNSVTSIGNEAFADCNMLEDVTFSSPRNGDHQGFKVGANAFKTGSDRLMFHGDIVKGYAPFEWAMDPNNIIKQPEGIRVCYKSLTPTYLTVMYNPNTELVTLLDYPKYNQVSKVLNEVHEHELFDSTGKKITYERWMELRSYDEYRASYYDDMRAAFANAWSTTTDKEDVYNSDNYGPWVNPEFCRNMVSGSGGGGGDETISSSSSTTQPDEGGDPDPADQGNALNTLTDWLFEPIVAYAADGEPIPYYSYSGNGYDVVKYSEMKDRKPWQTITSEAEALINATKEIVVPAGVDSIDVYGYYNNLDREGNELEVRVADNRENAKQYLTGAYGSWDTDTIKMYTLESVKDEDNINSVPGLFSGTYDDKVGEEKEKRTRGNDRIISVTLNSVKYLPDYAFDSCEQLTSVILGPDCADIGTAPFRGCYSLKAVGDNNYYKTNNGIVYSVNPDGSYAIEECLWARGLAGGVGEAQVSLSTDENLGRVSIIKDGAFEDCDNITLVDLTNTAGLVEIPKRCFKNCDNLNRVWLPGTVNSIDDEAFAGANQLSELQIPGKEVFISGHAFDESKAATTSVYTSEDSSAKRYVDTYGKRYKLEWHKKDNWRVIFLDADLNQIGKEQIVDDGAYADIPEDPVKDDWIFDRWLGTNNADPKNPIKADTTFVAVGYSTSSMVDGKYKVDFMDQVDGKIFSTQLVAPGGDAIIPQAPVHAGYTFLRYGGDSLTNIQKNSIALAMYSGGTGTGTNPGGNGGNGTTSGSSSSTQSSSSSSNDSVSGNSTSSTSSGAETVGKYTVTVINGSGSGTYDAGSTVIIAANTPATGKVFKNWTTESAGVTFASVSLSATTFVMPNNNVTVTANYVTGNGSALTGTSTNGNTGNNNNNGGTRVDITKPGISNKDLATANVNGSTDNFVVKISETPEATQAVVNALTNKYGNLDSVLYYAMDISLYDSTGTVKISDTSGLTVDITIPIPDALTVFGGNNMAGAVVAGDQLEDLSERFSTINGVPCISFTATHFSPYTIYVNTQQLSDGALDITPKTGDPIHPKWFLSLGLACLSVILFMKKDKKPVKVKAA